MITELTLGAIALGIWSASKRKQSGVQGIGLPKNTMTVGTVVLVVEKAFTENGIVNTIYHICKDMNAANAIIAERGNIAINSGYKYFTKYSDYDFEYRVSNFSGRGVSFFVKNEKLYGLVGM